ncbi:DUF3592 domain-containing protein [Chitinophaga sp.]|uniref:DUF3592 domain-containing protein n=1 Tax=Chitinophaga sp. TaxID=1869181 RepID=UPI002F941B7D
MLYKLYLLAGLILLAVSLYQLKQSVDFISGSKRVIGTVTSLEEIDGAYSPVFTVTTKENGEIIYHHASASSPAGWSVGEEAIFLYNPENPGSVRLMSYFWLFSWAIFFMGIAIPLIIMGGGYYFLNPLTRWPVKSNT